MLQALLDADLVAQLKRTQVTSLEVTMGGDHLPELIFELPQLESLVFSYFELTQLPDVFDRLPRLKHLDV